MKLKRINLRPGLKSRLKLKRKTAVKLGLSLAVVAFIAGGVILVFQMLNSPAEGTILKEPTIKVTPAAAKTPHIYSGEYFSFTVPGNFNVTPSPTNSGNLEVVKLFSNDHTSKDVAISIVRGSLGNDSGLNYRRTHTEIYSQQSAAQGSIVFSKNHDGTEYTGYLTHNDLEATISISSPFTNDLSADYSKIAKSWQWK